jgi:hypothetical protein
VTGVAPSRLLRLRKQHLLVANEEPAQGLKFIGQLAQLVDLYDARASGNLHDALVESYFPVKGRGRVSGAIIAHHRRLDHHPDVTPFREWSSHSFATCSGSVCGLRGSMQILLPIGAVAIGMTIFGLAFLFAVPHLG